MIALLSEKSAKTMSSREISNLVESRHADVCRTIERLIEKSVICGCAPTAYTHEQNGQQYTEYHLDKRSSLIVVAQLCPEFTARIVDRWQELEARTALPDFTNPAAAARAWADAVEAAQTLQIERDKAIATKAQIGSRREATAMATAGAAKREAAKLRDRLGASTRHATVRAVNAVTGHEYAWLPLRHWCKREEIAPVSVTDPLYGEVKAWPAGAWLECHAVEIAALFGCEAG